MGYKVMYRVPFPGDDMKPRSFLLALPLLLALTGAAGANAATAERTAEARLAEHLKGYEPSGAPVRCIPLRNIQSSQIFDRTAIVYDMGGGLRYLNRPANGGSSLRRDDVMVTDTHSSDLCSIDIVRMYDSASRMPTGFVGLGEFIPYRKARK